MNLPAVAERLSFALEALSAGLIVRFESQDCSWVGVVGRWFVVAEWVC